MTWHAASGRTRGDASASTRRCAVWVATVALGGCAEPTKDSASDGDALVGGPTEAQTEDGVHVVRYTTDPSPIPLSEDFVIRWQVERVDGASPDVQMLAVDGWMPEHGHGMNTTPSTVETSDGWTTEGMLFHMPGAWEIVAVVGAEGTQSRATLTYTCCAD